KLEEPWVGLVSTAAGRAKSDKPFEKEGDNSFRRIGGNLSASDLAVDDSHYDHGCIDKDVNCVFPIDRLRSLAGEGRIGGLTDEHFSLGFFPAPRQPPRATHSPPPPPASSPAPPRRPRPGRCPPLAPA